MTNYIIYKTQKKNQEIIWPQKYVLIGLAFKYLSFHNILWWHWRKIDGWFFFFGDSHYTKKLLFPINFFFPKKINQIYELNISLDLSSFFFWYMKIATFRLKKMLYIRNNIPSLIWLIYYGTYSRLCICLLQRYLRSEIYNK